MSKRAEEKAVEYQIKTHGPNVMGGASILSEDEYMRLNMNYDFKAGYEEAEKMLDWDWEKFRREAAKDILAATYNPLIAPCNEQVRNAITCAEELIRQLKDGK